jgi:hypothetical protein
MQPNLSKPQNTLDRLATLDEVRAAILPSSAPPGMPGGEFPREIAADVGGYVRIPSAVIETTLLVEELIQVQVQDAQSN